MARTTSLSQEQVEKLMDLYGRGYSDGEAAEQLGISRYVVMRFRKAHSLKANRKRGDRGLGRPKDNESYYLYTQRVLRNHLVADAMRKAVAKLFQLGRITAETAFVALGMEPARLTHPDPPPYAQDPERMAFSTGERIAKIEQFIERSGLAGVPGRAIMELAKIIKTSDEAEKERLAEQAVIEAGLVTSSATVAAIDWYVSTVTPVQEFIAKWREEIEQIREFTKNAPEKVRKGFAKGFTKVREYISRTGKKGKQGGVINIAARTAWAGAAGY